MQFLARVNSVFGQLKFLRVSHLLKLSRIGQGRIYQTTILEELTSQLNSGGCFCTELLLGTVRREYTSVKPKRAWPLNVKRARHRCAGDRGRALRQRCAKGQSESKVQKTQCRAAGERGQWREGRQRLLLILGGCPSISGSQASLGRCSQNAL